MDDERDRGYSRAPELEDLVALCRSLNEAGAKYLLIGGFAVILQGFVRATKDIDLLVDASTENVRALKVALGTLPDNAVRELGDDEIGRYRVVRIADEIVVDLMAEACGVTWSDAVKDGVETMEIEGVAIPVATKQLLIRTKQTARPSDAADTAFLQLRISEDDRG